MAYPQNGRGQQGQYTNPQGSSAPPFQYEGHVPPRLRQERYTRRTPSFDDGDDAGLPQEANGGLEEHAYGSRGYMPGSNTGVPNEALFPRASSPPPQIRSASHVPSAGGYRHHDVPPAVSTAQPSYNPQQYSRPQSQFNMQAYASMSNNFSAEHQTYVPAAYQATNAQRPAAYAGQPYGSFPQSYIASVPIPLPVQPPPLTQTQDEQLYSTRRLSRTAMAPVSQYSNYTQEPSYRQAPLPPLPGSAPLPPRPSPYTPPAPPPPPFSPNRDGFPSSALSAAPNRPYSQIIPTSRYGQQQPLENRVSNQNRLPSLPKNQPNLNSSVMATMNPQVSPPIPTPGNSLPSTPGPPPPQHSPERMNSTWRHPQARPLPGPPSASDSDSEYFDHRNGTLVTRDTLEEGGGYEDLLKEVEAAVMGTAPAPTVRHRSPRLERIDVHTPRDDDQEPRPLFSGASQTSLAPDTSHTHTNGHTGDFGSGQNRLSDAYSDGSDAEALAGLAAMQMAEEQEAADEARRHSGTDEASEFNGNASLLDNSAEHSSDSDVHVDMDSYGGGFQGHMHYGDQSLSTSSPLESLRQSERSNAEMEAYGSLNNYWIPNQDDIHPFPPTIGARVDTGGTGGLSEPSPHPRRLSFDDGDESILEGSEGGQTSGIQSPSFEGSQDMLYRPGASPSRPLPPAPIGSLDSNRIPQLMPAGSYQNPERSQLFDQYGHPSYPPAPDAYNQLLSPSGTPVPRSSSLISHSSTPQTVPPIRSKTDAEERRAKINKMQQLAGLRTASAYGSDIGLDSSLPQSAELLGLPEIPGRKKFNPGKLSTNDFRRCSEPWALSSIVAWIKEMSDGEADLKENAIIDGIVALFTHKVPTMNTADAEILGARVVSSMLNTGTLLKEEEWVKFGAEPMSGVLFQLTGTGCYSSRVHTQTIPGRCYAHHCMRTLRKINLQAQVLEPQRKVEDWATFYKVKKEDLEGVSKKEIERQNNLHEIVTTEDSFMDQLNVLNLLYRDELAKWQPPILPPKRKASFLSEVFGKVTAVKQVNEDYLLAQLKYRQQEQGPWIVGFSEIFREWIRKARHAYIEYAASFPNATFLVRQEAERNILFRQFLDQMRENEQSKRLGWDTYLKAPITRLQRYSLLLSTVYKNMVQDTEEKANLQTAIEEIRHVTLECDARVAEMSKHVDLSELASKLVLRPGMEKVQLNLTHLGREIIFKGDLQRTGSNKFTWLETHAILFDHYLVLAKTTSTRDGAGGLKYDKYDVSKLPIPMDLLVLETANDDAVVKSTVKGIASVSTVSTRGQAPQDIRLGRTISNQNGTAGPGTLSKTNTETSLASVNTNGSGKTVMSTTVLDSPKDERLMFPFRIKHLGKSEVYVLYAPTIQNRQDWCDKIIEAKTRHAASLFTQNAEPFRLRVVADTAFAYDAISGGGKSIIIKDTPLDRAIREVEKTFDSTVARPGPVCRASVNCATAFTQPYGDQKIAVGTDYGVYISDYNNPRGWARAIAAVRVTQIAVLEEFSLFLVIADKSLIAYHLDAVCPLSANPEPSSRRAPQKLSGARDVGFFATGRMKDRTLVFYKKREGISSTFKVLEPVYQKSSTSSRGRFGMRKGTTEFFRDFDDFYVPSETYAINLFHSSLAIASARGFEVLTLDKKVPFSIPDLKPPDCASIAARIRDQKPLGMFRLSDSEFLLVFEEVGIYVDKLGDVSRAVVMEFVGRAKQAVLYGGMYLVLVDIGGGFVEVRNAVNGRLRQVVSGKDVRLLDDGGGGEGKKGTVKICMQHPEYERSQIVVEMIVNEGLKE